MISAIRFNDLPAGERATIRLDPSVIALGDSLFADAEAIDDGKS